MTVNQLGFDSFDRHLRRKVSGDRTANSKLICLV
jgi:hypothetical protein